VEEDVEFGKLRGYLLSLPYESDKGGDIHFLSFCDQENLSKVVVADVAGHGQIVSKIALELRKLLRENVDEVDNGRLLFSINDTLRHKLREGKFVTMVAATFNGNKGDLIYAYAGHPTVFLFDSASKKWQLLQHVENSGSGIPLGMVGAKEYIQMRTRLRRGDMLLFYTDGLLGIKNNSDERLTTHDLLEACQKITATHTRPREIVSSLVKQLEESSEEGFTDDVTLLVVEVT
jgi:sigma-B regulation protein RsbU (phosphoserine phosphatase)